MKADSVSICTARKHPPTPVPKTGRGDPEFGHTKPGPPNLPLAKCACVLSNLRVLNQQTLNRSASFSGIGLHSGNRVNMTILPAPANSGVRFRRVDLEGKPEIEARVENISETNRSTTLAKGSVKIHTVEHVLAALAGYGIDNAVIELDANEPPIADGSSREFCKIIQSPASRRKGKNASRTRPPSRLSCGWVRRP